jgi:lysozyme family protein
MSEEYAQSAINTVLDHEGGAYIAHDVDRGPSKWGITWKTAQELGFLSEESQVADLTREQAYGFYHQYFWLPMGLAQLSDATLAGKLLDLGVNIGARTVSRWLQQAVNSMGATVRVDGNVGPETAAAVNGKDGAAVLASVKAIAAQYYRTLAEKQPDKYAKFLEGWLTRLDV